MKNTAQKFLILSLMICASSIKIAAQTCATVPSGLVSWYRAENNALDSNGTNHGTLQNGAGFALGKVGQSFNFDGTDDSVGLSLTQTFQNITLEAWVKPLSAVNDTINQELILGQAGFGSQIVVIPGTSGGMRVKIQYRDTSNSFTQLTATADIPLDDWSHLVGTFDGTTLKLFINGVLDTQLNPLNTTVQTCATPYFIGGFQTVTDCNNITNQPFQFFNGLIDEASIYNRALTDAEILAIFNAGSAGKCFAATAASVRISGRVTTATGRGIGRARVSLTDSSGETRAIVTNPFGYYRFETVAAGETFILETRHKNYAFAPQVIFAAENLSDVNIKALP